ncbi:MAG: hypothetical protein K5655_02965 [Lachnospiraceae bacterium]|nr:hypothetical protein [Lachnospiraceae bacterium]
MKTDDIKDYLDRLSPTEEDFAKYEEEFKKELTKDNEDYAGLTDALDEISFEINDRLDQAEDEDRIKKLEMQSKLVDSALTYVKELSSREKEEPKKPESVLIVDDSVERIEDPSLLRPVSLTPEDIEKQKALLNEQNEAAKREEKEKRLEEEAKRLLERKKAETGSQTSPSVNDIGILNNFSIGSTTSNGSKPGMAGAGAQGGAGAVNGNPAETVTNAAGGSVTGGAPGSPASPSPNPAGGVAALGNDSQRLMQALIDYKNFQRDAARKVFESLANSKELSKEELGNVRFLYGVMLKKGEGGAKDVDKGKFWISSSAELDNVDALMEMGADIITRTPKNHQEEAEMTKQALGCFEKANKETKGGNATAKKKYIDICENKPITKFEKAKAFSYLNDLIDESNDEYEKKKLRDRKKTINDNYRKKLSFVNPERSILDCIFTFVGAPVSVIGSVLVFLSIINHGTWMENFIGKYSFGTLHVITDIWEEIFRTLGTFFSSEELYTEIYIFPIAISLIVFGVGRVIMGMSFKNGRGKTANIFDEVSTIAALAAAFGGLFTYLIEGAPIVFFAGALTTTIMMLALVLVGWLAGKALYFVIRIALAFLF